MRKYRAPLVSWWKALTEGFMRCRLVVERIQQRLDDVAPGCQRHQSHAGGGGGPSRRSVLMEMIYAGTNDGRRSTMPC